MNSNSRMMKNNFDLLRLLFASTVCLVHVSKMSDYKQLALLSSVLSSVIAVKAFFIVSGFLIFMSFDRSSSLISYATKRVRRIYPAYFTVIMLCALGLVLTGLKSVNAYFTMDWVKYVFANLSFLSFIQPTLPGVFDSNKLQTINGALWTLKVEVLFYMSVPLIVFLFKKFGRITIILILYILSVVYTFLCSWLAKRTGSGIYLVLDHQFPGQLSYFMAGAFFYYYLPIFERYVHYFIILAICILAVSYFWSMPLLEPFSLATVVIFFAFFIYLGNFAKYGDFSYGVYILHFPIIQLFIYFKWLESEPWLFLISIVVVTFIAAFAMWHLVEKRFLSHNNHYVDIST